MTEKSQLVVHAGGWPATREQVVEVVPPESTESYTTVAHGDMIQKISAYGQDLLQADVVKESYALARDGKRLFGFITFGVHENNGLGLSVAFRNSYDKSMSIGIALGMRVFVCDNLAISGEIRIVQKHTGDVWGRLEDVMIAALYKSRQFELGKFMADKAMLQAQTLTENQGYEKLGLLLGNNVISGYQATHAFEQWRKPSFKDFEERNAWSLYNACTYALKTTPPHIIMEKHRRLHEYMMEDW